MSQEIDIDRRHLVGTAAATIAAAQLGASTLVYAQSDKTKAAANLPTIKPGTNTSFASLKQIDAGLLNVGYAEAGPAGGPAVILLHGWPYDIYSFVDVAPLLAGGLQGDCPYLRGTARRAFFPVRPSGTASHP
jgi:hypothetical protein